MAAAQDAQSINHLFNRQAILLALALLLPGLAPSLFGWLNGLLATPVFCLLCINGQKKGTLLIRNGVLFAVAAAILLKLVPALLFSLTLVPLGYSFSISYNRSDDEIQSGAKGTIVLAVTWLIFWGAYGIAQDINPYQHLLEMMDTFFVQIFEYYSKNVDLPAEKIHQLGQSIDATRKIIPLILPGLLCCTVLITVWFNLAISNIVQARLQPDHKPWKKYSQWRLPDKLVWLPIATGIYLLIGKGIPHQAVLAIFFIAVQLYFFQGLAVFIHMLEKWKIPVYLRILFYVIIFLQYYFGLLLLTILGLVDVWFDFRRMHTIDNTDGT